MISKRFFGRTPSGEDVYIYDIENSKIKLSVMEFGAAVISLYAPDREGGACDIVCGYDDLDSYIEGDGYQGAVVGRWANRINKGKFTLDGVEYSLYCNNGENHLHGGKTGFSHRVWKSEITGECSVRFSYLSPDGEEEYPGNLSVCVDYVLSDDKISLKYSAQSDKNTIINLTNHTYFNLSGFDSGKVFDHELKVRAHSYLPTDEGLIPTGEIRSVENTPFDFRVPKTIGRDFDLSNRDLMLAGGYDHCLVFEDTEKSEPEIEVYEKKSGRGMRVYTNQPCVHFYTGNFLVNKKYPFKGNYPQSPQNAFCLETEIMPDSMNHEGFTNPVLKAGERYERETSFEFYVK